MNERRKAKSRTYKEEAKDGRKEGRREEGGRKERRKEVTRDQR